MFGALAALKDELDINVELAGPDNFIPAIPGWPERSLFIARHGSIEFFHYDPYGQALSKLQRGHDRDLRDVQSLWRSGLVEKRRLRAFFAQIAPQLIRYPAIDPAAFRAAVDEFVTSAGDLIRGLPGESLVREGLADVAAGRCTVASCLVAIAGRRLVHAGLLPPSATGLAAEPELQLYRFLRAQGGDAYSRYNSLLRELTSFEQALVHRLRLTA